MQSSSSSSSSSSGSQTPSTDELDAGTIHALSLSLVELLRKRWSSPEEGMVSVSSEVQAGCCALLGKLQCCSTLMSGLQLEGDATADAVSAIVAALRR